MIPPWFEYLAAFLFGSVVGSFLNVCIHRLPLDESVVFPPSKCPGCGARIRPRDNIPILGYLLLRGRCRDCGMAISPRYPLVEAVTAGLFALYTWRLGLSPTLLPHLTLASALVVIFSIDLSHQIIPNVITVPGMIAGLAFTPLLPRGILEGVIGLLAGGIFFYLVVELSFLLLKREGMGMGDVKMAAMMGAFLGWKMLMVAVFLALMLGSAAGIFLLSTGRRGRKDAIPFGPFLVVGTILATLWGREILDWYLNLTL